MDLCALCKKENPILGITSKVYPIGAKCYGKLTDASVGWEEDSTLEQIKDALRQARRAERLNARA